MTSQLFLPPGGAGMSDMAMGVRGKNGRYKVPVLPGEKCTKAAEALPEAERWVSGGVQSMTNLASSISDTKALGMWELEQALLGVGLNPDLAEELRNAAHGAVEAGVDLQKLKLHPHLREHLAGIAERAKDVAGANQARDAGIVRHDVWEDNGKSEGQLFTGTEQINSEIAAVRALLAEAGLEVVPELCERTVRNVEIQAAGRFDNILLELSTGRLLMADLKTKREKFWTWMEIDAQLAGYAYAEYMLIMHPDGTAGYEPGPRTHVDLTEGVVLHMPSDGAPPALRRADLLDGWETMKLARQVCTRRSRGASAARNAESFWVPKNS